MNYMIGALLMLLTQLSYAAECSANGGPWFFFQDWYNTMRVDVTLSRIPGSNRLNFNGFSLSCRFSPGGGGGSNAQDYWHTEPSAINVGPKFLGKPAGVNVKGTDYLYSLPGGIHVATTNKNGPSVGMSIYMFVLNTRGVHVRVGDLLGTIPLRQTSNYNAGTHPRIQLYAANELSPDLSTCTINGNAPIVVDFNQVDLNKVGESASSTQVKSNVRLNYSCSESGFTLPIKITFTGSSAGFNSGVLRMSNVNLGTALLRGTTQISPGASFNSTISNSSGGDTMTFALIRKSQSTPATGAFTGSAALVIGYQ